MSLFFFSARKILESRIESNCLEINPLKITDVAGFVRKEDGKWTIESECQSSKDLFFDGHMEGLSEKDGKNILEIKKGSRPVFCMRSRRNLWKAGASKAGRLRSSSKVKILMLRKAKVRYFH
jgi:hypothetical protein